MSNMVIGTGDMGGTAINVTTAACFIPELWYPEVIAAREANLVFGKCIKKVVFGKKGRGDTMNIPLINAITAHAKAANTSVNFQTSGMGDTAVQLIINKSYEASFLIEDDVTYEQGYPLSQDLGKQAGIGLATQMDTDIATLVNSFLTTHTVGDGTGYVDDDMIIQAMQKLDESKVPRTERKFIVTPANFWNLMRNDKFVDASKLGKSSSPITTGTAFYFYGVPMEQTTNVYAVSDISYNALIHTDALCYAVAKDMKAETARFAEFLADGVITHILYGCVGMRRDHGVALLTK